MDDLPPPHQLQQAARASCVYCDLVRPGAGPACPLCRGAGERDIPGRMMDGPTSRAELLRALTQLGDPWEGRVAHDCDGAQEAEESDGA